MSPLDCYVLVEFGSKMQLGSVHIVIIGDYAQYGILLAKKLISRVLHLG